MLASPVNLRDWQQPDSSQVLVKPAEYRLRSREAAAHDTVPESVAVALDQARAGHRNSIHEQDVLALREAQVELRREQLKGARLAEENEELRKEVDMWRATARHAAERDRQAAQFLDEMMK